MITGLRVVDLTGSPREMGRAHGEELRTTIADGLSQWFDLVQRRTGHAGEAYAAGFVSSTSYTRAIEAYTPELMDEVKGIAEGARQKLEVILAYQMMDEEWAYRVALVRARRATIQACSAVGVVRKGSSLVAQNMDLPSHYDGTQVVLRLHPENAPGVMIFGPAGMIGTTGLNSEGVAVCCNALFQLRHRTSGLPVGFVVRAMLGRHSAEDAVALLKTVPHATGQNYIVGDPTDVYDLEASPSQVRELPRDGAQVAHTNHPLVNDDLDDQVGEDPESTTVERLARVRSDLARLGNQVTVDDVKRTLSDREVPVCVPRGSDWMTLGSLVMELSAEPVLHFAPGPPADTPYSEIRFE